MKARFCVWRGPTGCRCTMPRIWNWLSGKAYLLPRLTPIFKRRPSAKGWRFSRFEDIENLSAAAYVRENNRTCRGRCAQCRHRVGATLKLTPREPGDTRRGLDRSEER